jgi:hypothetical protein
MEHSRDGLPTMSSEVWSRYAAALRGYDSGLRAIDFPASVRPIVATLLADDAQMEAYFDKMARGEPCDCQANHFRLKAKIAGDVDQLRAALGLPPAGQNGEPGH